MHTIPNPPSDVILSGAKDLWCGHVILLANADPSLRSG
jgi:hypothetical protein